MGFHPVRIQLLGRFAVRMGEQTFAISSRRRRALIGYLAMQPGFSETRERLAALLWGDAPDRQARQSLRQALASLRSDLEPIGIELLRGDRDIIGFDPDTIAVDARELLAHADAEDIDALEHAAALYTGPFLDGVDIAAEGFGEWLQHQRHRIDAAASAIFARGAAAADAAGNGALAARLAERLLALDPTQSGAHHLHLRLLARTRGRDLALAEAERIERNLRNDLGVGFDARTRALIGEIRAEQIGMASAPAAASTSLQSDAEPPAYMRPAPILRRRHVLWAAITTVALVAAGVFGWLTLHTKNDMKLASGVNAAAGLSTRGLNPIMVLPFVSDDAAETQRAADLLTDELISDLSAVNSLRVISRSTSRLFKGKTFDIAVIGTELGVRYVVDGSVHVDNGTLRVDAALSDTSSRLQVWSQRFERPVAELAAVRTDLTRSIARQMQVTIFRAEGERLPPRPSDDPALEDLLAKGWAAQVRSPREGLSANAAGYFEAALKRAPDNRSAQLGYAGSQIVPATMAFGRSSEFDLDRADTMLNAVLTASPRSSTALLYRGMLRRLRNDLPGARDDFLAAIEISPSFATAYGQAGQTIYRLGDYDRGLDYVSYAMRLSPRDPGLGVWSQIAGFIEIQRGNDAAAFDWLNRSVTLLPRGIYARLGLVSVLALRGDTDAAADQMRELSKIAPWLTMDTVRAGSLGAEPKRTHARLMEGIEKAFAAAPRPAVKATPN
jgi:TolB-like protein/DNA-binding SARP family transcriptional activator